MSPGSDIVGPSPVTSNGTEIEDEAAEEIAEQANFDVAHPAQVAITTPLVFKQTTNRSQLMMIKTNIPDHVRKSLFSEEVVSVIHAPQSFQSWVWP